MSEFETVARKFIRVPWEVYEGKRFPTDATISASLEHSIGAGTFFKTAPEVQNMDNVFMAMSVPIICASGCNDSPTLQERNQWKNLARAEQEYVLAELGLEFRDHASMLLLYNSFARARKIASYIAAAFAFTTYAKPVILNFQEFSDIVLGSAGEFNHPAFDDVKKFGLLILTDLSSGETIGSRKVLGALLSVLRYRMDRDCFTVIMDYAEGDVSDAMRKGLPIYRESVVDMYKSIYSKGLRMQQALVGEDVYIFPVNILEAARERGKAVII